MVYCVYIYIYIYMHIYICMYGIRIHTCTCTELLQTYCGLSLHTAHSCLQCLPGAPRRKLFRPAHPHLQTQWCSHWPKLNQIECFLQYVLRFLRYVLTVCVMLVCGDLCFPFLRCLHCYHCLLGGTVGCHCDCIRSCYSCVILAELQAETEGYTKPYRWQL